MPEKRNEVVEKAYVSEMMPDLFESWLMKQKSGAATARSGFMGSDGASIAGEDREEDRIDNAESAHEKAKKRKRGLKGH